jgi:hypothetical protein
MKAVNSSELSVNFYQAKLRDIPEESHRNVIESTPLKTKCNKTTFSNSTVYIRYNMVKNRQERSFNNTKPKTSMQSCPYCFIYIYIYIYKNC